LERLQKFMAHAGIGSRRNCEELILQGKVKVNGQIITILGTKIDPEMDEIEVNNKLIKEKEDMLYILLNKPDGYVTTSQDPQGRPTVIDLIKEINKRIYPVGRLDYETEGLLLLTNDGELAYRLTHPKYKVNKVYQALVKGRPSNEAIEHLRRGVLLEDGLTEPAEIKILDKIANNTLIELTIHEGKNRQVRRMCKAVNHPVINLKRTKIGSLDLGNIKLGSFRFLTKDELRWLRNSVGLG